MGSNGTEYDCDTSYCGAYARRSWLGLISGSWHYAIDFPSVFGLAGSSVSADGYWNGEPATTGIISSKSNISTGTNFMRVSASSLGSGAFGMASPNRPGYYQIKYFVNAARAINHLAGRTLVTFVYPDQLTPKDMQR